MFGCWHSELEDSQEVLNFVCLGGKSYAMLIKDKCTGRISSIVKCKGLTLSSQENEKLVNYELYSSYLSDFLKEVTNSKMLSQYRKKSINSLAEELKTHYTKIVFSNAISIKGVINRHSDNLLIKPFGHG